jgi:hypothetical protein
VYTPDSLSIAHGTLPFYQPMDHHQIVPEISFEATKVSSRSAAEENFPSRAAKEKNN